MRIGIISTFGPEIQGVSPYADSLSVAIESELSYPVKRFDFSYLYPKTILPVENTYNTSHKLINILKPSTWSKVLKQHLDILHLQYWLFLTIPAYYYIVTRARKLKVSTVLTVHNPAPHEFLPFIPLLEAKLFKQVDRIIVHTHKGKEILIERGINEKNIKVIPHGIDTPSINNSKIEKQKQILYFGNIRNYKGVDVLLNAWDEIKSNHPEYKLVIAGRLWNGNTLIQKAVGKLLKTDKITKELAKHKKKNDSQLSLLLHFIDDKVLNIKIDESIFCVFPYKKFESQSGAVSKACGRGCPVIVTNVGGLAELAIDQSFLVPADDVFLLGQCLSQKIKESEVNNWHQRIIKQKAIANNLNWLGVANSHLHLYKDLKSAHES
ncbi:MAG: glycosyltransferase family 4 protein [Colwellia sp.]|nr:glycosyltransferase family 4 protein [Colwellia sp.]